MALFLYNYENELKKLFKKYPNLKSVEINKERDCVINGRPFRFSGFKDEDLRGWLVEEDFTMSDISSIMRVVQIYRGFIGKGHSMSRSK